MTRKFSDYLMIASFVLIASSCAKNEEAKPKSTSDDPLTVNLSPVYTYDTDSAGNFTNKDVILGRVLFYDKRLSIDNSTSCASCHKQSLGFGDSLSVSVGVHHTQGTRNSIALQNLMRQNIPGANIPLFWDGRETDLSIMVGDPIINPIEMGQSDLQQTYDKLNQLTDYKEVIKATYNDGRKLDQFTVSHALTAFLSTLRSTQSRSDLALKDASILTDDELAGRTLFFEKYNCATCHLHVGIYGDGAPDSATNFVNIGLDVVYTDQGRGAFTQNQADNGKFKIPDLHNVAVTAPYMHDGRFQTLDQVLEHYSSGIVDHPNLDLQLRDSVTFQPRKMNISEEEKERLIAFLNTMTDPALLTDLKYSNPFKKN